MLSFHILDVIIPSVIILTVDMPSAVRMIVSMLIVVLPLKMIHIQANFLNRTKNEEVNIKNVQKDYLSQLSQVYIWQLFTTVQNITTIYKNYKFICIQYKHIQIYLETQKWLKMPSSLKLGLFKTVYEIWA